jgi:hypothetical protein
MSFNIWEYVKFLAGIVVIFILLIILFEMITTFIRNRRRQSIEDKLLDDAQNAFSEIIAEKISKEIDKAFKKTKE